MSSVNHSQTCLQTCDVTPVPKYYVNRLRLRFLPIIVGNRHFNVLNMAKTMSGGTSLATIHLLKSIFVISFIKFYLGIAFWTGSGEQSYCDEPTQAFVSNQ